MTHKSSYRGPSIPVGCKAPLHHDEEGYAERGYHLVRYWRYSSFDEGGVKPDHNRPAVIATGRMLSLKAPIRKAAKGMQVVHFKCPCGEHRQANDVRLDEIAQRLIQEFGSEAWIDICRL